jgi:Phage portal protein, SPP1 Gp6-like
MTYTLEMNDRKAQFRRSFDHYVGRPPQSLIPASGQPDDNLYLSLARLIVDKGASFLFGEEVHGQVTDSEPEEEQDWLDECWRRNKRSITLQKLATNGGIYGHCFIRLLDPTPRTAPYPRVIVLDSSIVDVETDPDDIDEVWSYTITPPPRHRDGEPETERRTFITTPSGQAGYHVAQSGWFVVDQELQGGEWTDVLSVTWPHDFAPIVDCQNLPRANDFWGESDLPNDILNLLEGINSVASRYNKIIRIHSHPKIYTTGIGSAKLDLAVDKVISLPNENAKLQALEMQSDLASTMALLEKLIELLAMQARIPLVALGRPDNLGAISGVALQIRYQPLLEKNESKRLTYGDLLVELDQRLLSMGGFDDGIATELHWPDVMPQDLLAERQVWVIDEELGIVSKETLATKAGYDWDAESTLRAQEAQDATAQMAQQQTALGVVPAAPAPNGNAPLAPPPAALVPQVPDQAKKGVSR